MTSEMAAWLVAITLGVVVVGAGLRRNLADTTRKWLPRPGEVSEREVATLRSPKEGRRPRSLTPRQRRWVAGGFLLLGLAYAAMALLSANDRLIHAVLAALWAIIAAGYFRGRLPLLAK
jgi:AcrR family transcriptional regulator